MRTNKPAVSGHVMSAPCCSARYARISDIVAMVPLGIVRMYASTSSGLGTSIVPALHRQRSVGTTSITLGSFGLIIFSRQLFRGPLLRDPFRLRQALLVFMAITSLAARCF